ncbi:MAG: iron chaperone [Burkholderiales bacterium]
MSNVIARNSLDTIDDYIATFPKHVQAQLQRVRRAIAKAAPGAEEAISYRIPAFKLKGRYLIYFAGFKTHIGLYPIHADEAAYSQKLARYASGKATFRFSLDQPMPVDLIASVVKAKVGMAMAGTKRIKTASAT